MTNNKEINNGKKNAALAALSLVKEEMTLGLGTGSTVYFFLEGLSAKIKKENLRIQGVASSEKTAILAKKFDIPLIELDSTDSVDLVVDGADFIDPNGWMIKGGGGALFREKILSFSGKQVAVIADSSKLTDSLEKHPLPIEVLPYGHSWTGAWLNKLGADFKLRLLPSGAPFFTDNGNLLFDLIKWPGPLEKTNTILKQIPGVIETGLFTPYQRCYFVGWPNGNVETRS